MYINHYSKGDDVLNYISLHIHSKHPFCSFYKNIHYNYYII